MTRDGLARFGGGHFLTKEHGATMIGFIVPIVIGLPLEFFGLDILRWGGEPYFAYPIMFAVIFPRTHFEDAWANLFAGQCGGNECTAPCIYTAPFYASVAYSLASILFRRRTRG